MDALLFAMNLEVMLLQLRILDGSVERCDLRWVPRSKHEAKKRDKLFRDRQIVKDVVLRTLTELAEDGEWRTLQHAVKILDHSSTSVVTLRTEYEQLKTSLKETSRELITMKHHWTLKLSNCDEKVADLRDKTKDSVLNANTRQCYAEKWLCARAESMELQFQIEATPAAVPNADHEYRIHNELLRAYDLQIKEREESLEYWMLRCENDITKLNKRLTEQCEKLRVTVARRMELQDLYDLHKGEIRGWLTFKKEREARRAKEERLRVAATRIQAWWRGVMVRRALGSFRYLRNAKKTPAKSKKK